MDNDQSNIQPTKNTTDTIIDTQPNTPQISNPTHNEPTANPANNSLKGVYVTLLIVGILAFAGIALGIFGTVQASRAMHYLKVRGLDTEIEEVSDEVPDDDEEENVFTAPTDAEDITSITITYNNDNDYISLVRDLGTIEYYAYDETDDYKSNIIEKDVSDIIKYIFDNGSTLITDEGDYSLPWIIEIETEDSRGYINGTSPSPAWFDTLLNMLDVNTNGYLSNK